MESANETRGVDVYHGDGGMDWEAVAKDGIMFAFVKATEGLTLIDPRFQRNWLRTKEVGIVRGAYHFFRPEEDAGEQAERFLQMVKLDENDLPPTLDVEVDGGVGKNLLLIKTRKWLDIVERGVGRKPIIYTSPSFWDEHMNDEFGDHPLWVAHYTAAKNPRLPAGWAKWSFWQYTEEGRTGSIPHTVDLDRFNGSMNELIAFVQSDRRVVDSAPTPKKI